MTFYQNMLRAFKNILHTVHDGGLLKKPLYKLLMFGVQIMQYNNICNIS